jgi:hypothetical protein
LSIFDWWQLHSVDSKVRFSKAKEDRMKSTRKSLRLFACIVVSLFVTACSRDPKQSAPQPPLDPVAEGERLMRSMSDTLAQSKAFTFETRELLEVIAPGGEKRMVHFTRKVTVRRPNALFFELHGKADAPFEVDAYYDGRTVSLNEKGNGKWAQTTVPGTLDEMLDDVAKRFGLPIPIGDVVYSSPYDAFIGSSTMGGVVGQETIDGVPCSKLDYGDDLVQVRLWLPTSGQPLPRRLEIVYKKAPTSLTTQLNFSNWNLNAPVTDSTFTFQPPKSKAVAFGDFTADLVKRVVPAAPQVAAADTGAKSAGASKTR